MIARDETEKALWQQVFAARFDDLVKTQLAMALPHLSGIAMSAMCEADAHLRAHRDDQPQRTPRQLGPAKGKRRGLSKQKARRRS